MKQQTREDPKIVAAAERRMRAWALAQEVADWAVRIHRVDQPHVRLGPYITISREAGAGGSRIAERVGRTLGWEVLDKNLVDCVAQQLQLSPNMLHALDETPCHWAYELFSHWLDSRVVSHEKYVVHLGHIVAAAARRGNVVLVGRGAQFFLPRDQGLAVRIIAPEKYRLGQIMHQHGMTEEEARQYLTEVDQGRADFVARFFHHDVSDPHLYDLVINVEHLGPEAAADQIVAAWHQLGTRRTG